MEQVDIIVEKILSSDNPIETIRGYNFRELSFDMEKLIKIKAKIFQWYELYRWMRYEPLKECIIDALLDEGVGAREVVGIAALWTTELKNVSIDVVAESLLGFCNKFNPTNQALMYMLPESLSDDVDDVIDAALSGDKEQLIKLLQNISLL